MLVVWIILSHCTNQDSGSCVLWSPALIILRYLDFSVGEDKIHYYCYYYCHYYHRASAVAFSISRYTGGRKYEKYTHDMRYKILVCVQCQDRVRNYWGGSFAFLIVNQQWRKMAAAAPRRGSWIREAEAWVQGAAAATLITTASAKNIPATNILHPLAAELQMTLWSGTPTPPQMNLLKKQLKLEKKPCRWVHLSSTL